MMPAEYVALYPCRCQVAKTFDRKELRVYPSEDNLLFWNMLFRGLLGGGGVRDGRQGCLLVASPRPACTLINNSLLHIQYTHL